MKSELAAQQTDQLSREAGFAPLKQTVNSAEYFRELAASLGLPKDALSVALLAFTRFFSLSPSQALIGNLRREVLALIKNPSAAPSTEKGALEAKALAAVIAADKGVVLQPEALERYARFLMPGAFEVLKASKMPLAVEPEKREHGANHGAAQDGKKESAKEKLNSDEINPQKVRRIAETQPENDALLDCMNSFPGENGHYWYVFPFVLETNGIELAVSLRILKSYPYSSTEEGRLIVDIQGPKRQWSCFLEKNAKKIRAKIGVYPECSPRALDHLRKRAKRFLGKGFITPQPGISGFTGFDEIIVQNRAKKSSWIEDLSMEHLPSIDEEV